MDREFFKEKFFKLMGECGVIALSDNYFSLTGATPDSEQSQTNEVFSEKWGKHDRNPEKDKLFDMQKNWYLSLYGFDSDERLAVFLRGRKIIFDAGCGLGYKTAWFAQLSPESLVIGMDFSDAARQAAINYAHLPNLFFIKGDIAKTPFLQTSIDYVVCDQVIMHTQNPDQTFSELVRITRQGGGEFSCYFYAKKALARELLDDHFRSHCLRMSSQEMWEMAEQLAELGKRLSELKVSFDAPAIPSLGIKGGPYDLQRFIYWNFLKCFWNEELGRETSIAINYDWYSPSNARRFSREEVKDLIRKNGLSVVHFHQEEACYSGRFIR